MADDAAGVANHALRHWHHAWTNGRHLRPVVQRIDRAEQRAAEGRPRCGQRAVRIDVELGAIGGEAGE